MDRGSPASPQVPVTSTPAAEIALIGACLIDPEAVGLAADVLAPAAFASARWREVFDAMLAVHERGVAVDYVTVCDELAARGTLDRVKDFNLTAAINCCPTSLNAIDYARAVARAARARMERTLAGYALPAGGVGVVD